MASFSCNSCSQPMQNASRYYPCTFLHSGQFLKNYVNLFKEIEVIGHPGWAAGKTSHPRPGLYHTACLEKKFKNIRDSQGQCPFCDKYLIQPLDSSNALDITTAATTSIQMNNAQSQIPINDDLD